MSAADPTAVGELRWIDERGECERLRATLAPASETEQRGKHEAGNGSLRAFLTELEAQHGPG